VIDGTLKSWAIPQGPSLNPSDKGLAIEVEDHTLDYADFEGVISDGKCRVPVDYTLQREG